MGAKNFGKEVPKARVNIKLYLHTGGDGARNIDSLLNQQILPVLSQQLLQRQALGQSTRTVMLGYCEDSGISLSFSEEHDAALLDVERD